MTALTELLARCEAATGANYALEVKIRGVLESDRPSHLTTPYYTCSLDAAVALIERMLPGCNWIVAKGRTRPDEPLFGAQIMRPGMVRDEVIGEGELEASSALALICALLRALIAREAGHA